MNGHYIHRPVVSHVCRHPGSHSGDPLGTVWRCECGEYWRYGYTEESWGPTWYQPFWLNVIPQSWAEWLATK